MIAAMDRFGVDAACVYTIMGFYGDCPRHNDALLARCREYPDRLVPFVTVDPKEGPAAVDELERCLEFPEFRGVKFHPWLQAFASQHGPRHDDRDPQGRGPDLDPGALPRRHAAVLDDLPDRRRGRWVPEATVVLGHAGSADYTDPAAQLIRDLPESLRLLLRVEARRPGPPGRDRRGRQDPLRFRLRSRVVGASGRAAGQHA